MNVVPGSYEEARGIRRLIFGRRPMRTLWRVLFWSVAGYVIFRYVLLPMRVEGISMEPTFKDGAVSVANRLTPRWGHLQRGDVVAVRVVSDRVLLLKRIVGLPGERLAIVAGQVFINRQRLEEPYTKPNPQWFHREIQLQPEQYFVIGDNRTMIQQAHTFGPCMRSNIVGRVLF